MIIDARNLEFLVLKIAYLIIQDRGGLGPKDVSLNEILSAVHYIYRTNQLGENPERSIRTDSLVELERLKLITIKERGHSISLTPHGESIIAISKFEEKIRLSYKKWHESRQDNPRG